MKDQAMDDYYTSQKSELLEDFDNYMGEYGRKVLASHFGDGFADTVLKKSHQKYEDLIPKLPYVGGKNNALTPNLVGSTWFLALYMVLKAHGKTVNETGKIAHEILETELRSHPKRLLRLRVRAFTSRMNKLKRQAADSQKRLHRGNWVWSSIQGDGKEFDYGVDFTECAICKFFHTQGADELVPFLCAMDFISSKALGMGLVRTMTIAEGAGKCDFRWKRGRETKQGAR